MDRRIQAAETYEVVEIVDVVRIPVVLGRVTEVGVVDANLLELLASPTELLVDVVGRDHRAVGEPHLFPIQRYGGRHSLCGHL